jgi:hypothetical protein
MPPTVSVVELVVGVVVGRIPPKVSVEVVCETAVFGITVSVKVLVGAIAVGAIAVTILGATVSVSLIRLEYLSTNGDTSKIS